MNYYEEPEYASDNEPAPEKQPEPAPEKQSTTTTKPKTQATKKTEATPKTPIDVFRHMNKYFPERETIEETPLDEPLEGVMDNAQVSEFAPKNKWLKEYITSTFKTTWTKTPDLTTPDNEHRQRSKYAGEYIAFICDIAKNYDTVTLTMRTDGVLTVETDDFIYYLAPRIENEN